MTQGVDAKYRRIFLLFGSLFVVQVFSAGCGNAASGPVERSAKVLDEATLNTEQIAALDRSKTVVLLPGGILEEHGPYLPSYADGYQSEFLATRLADAIAAHGWTVLRFPLLPLGAMPASQLSGKFTFAGSYPVRMATLRAVYMDLASDLGEAGFKWIVVVNYHGGPTHNLALDLASRYFEDTYGGHMINLFGLVSVAGASPRDLFTAVQRKAEGFGLHADADEHSRIMFLRPDLVPATIRDAAPAVAPDIPDLVPLARKDGWPGYFGTPAIANASAGERAMNALSAAAIDAALKFLDGTLAANAARVYDDDQDVPTFKQITDEGLAHDRQVEERQAAWIARLP